MGLARGLLVANATVLTVAFGAGWSSVGSFRVRLAPPPGVEATVSSMPAYSEAAMVEETWRIALVNGRAFVVLLVLGTCSGGIYGWFVIGSNGFAIGRMLAAVADGAPELLPLVGAYAPFEFAAMVIGSTVSQHLFVGGVRWLGGMAPLSQAWGGRVVGLGVLLLVAAALLEADARQRVEW